MSWFPLHSWKIFFARYIIWSWQFFYFSTWKMLCYFLLHPMVPEKKSPVIWIDSSLCIMCQYWLVVLKMFLKECLLVFKSLIMEYFGMNFFGFFLFRIILDSGVWVYGFAKFWKFSAIISLAIQLLSSSSRPPVM